MRLERSILAVVEGLRIGLAYWYMVARAVETEGLRIGLEQGYCRASMLVAVETERLRLGLTYW